MWKVQNLHCLWSLVSICLLCLQCENLHRQRQDRQPTCLPDGQPVPYWSVFFLFVFVFALETQAHVFKKPLGVYTKAGHPGRPVSSFQKLLETPVSSITLADRFEAESFNWERSCPVLRLPWVWVWTSLWPETCKNPFGFHQSNRFWAESFNWERSQEKHQHDSANNKLAKL